MIEQNLKNKIYKYYKTPESRWGYSLFLWDSKHLGYYPDPKQDIGERRAQLIYQDKIAESLILTAGQKVLDAGCGRGVVACYLAEKYGVSVTGIDLVDFEIRAAEERASRLDVANKTAFKIMDYADIDFPDNSFDAVYANETLSHAPDLSRVLSELFRVLKPGGRIVLFEYTIAEDKDFSPLEMKDMNLVIDVSGMAGLKQFHPRSIVPFMTSAGFKHADETDITPNLLPSFRRLYNFTRPIYPLVKAFGLQKSFINTVAAATFYPMVQKGLISFYIYSGNKPAN